MLKREQWYSRKGNNFDFISLHGHGPYSFIAPIKLVEANNGLRPSWEFAYFKKLQDAISFYREELKGFPLVDCR